MLAIIELKKSTLYCEYSSIAVRAASTRICSARQYRICDSERITSVPTGGIDSVSEAVIADEDAADGVDVGEFDAWFPPWGFDSAYKTTTPIPTTHPQLLSSQVLGFRTGGLYTSIEGVGASLVGGGSGAAVWRGAGAGFALARTGGGAGMVELGGGTATFETRSDRPAKPLRLDLSCSLLELTSFPSSVRNTRTRHPFQGSNVSISFSAT